MTNQKIPISVLPVVFFSAFTLGVGLSLQFFHKPHQEAFYQPTKISAKADTRLEGFTPKPKTEQKPNQSPTEVLIHSGQVLGATNISPDDSEIATAIDSSILIWDTHTAELLASFPTPCPSKIVSYSPNGDKLLVWGEDQMWRMMDAETGKILYKLPAPSSFYAIDKRVYFSEEGYFLIAPSDQEVKLYDVETGHLAKEIKLPKTSYINSIDAASIIYDEGETLIIGSTDGKIRFFDMQTGKLQKTLSLPNNQSVEKIAASPLRNYLIAQTENDVVLWNLSTSQIEKTFTEASCVWNHENPFSPFSLNGEKVIILEKQSTFPIQVYDIETKKQIGFQGKNPIWTTDGKFLAYVKKDLDRKIIFWDQETLNVVHDLPETSSDLKQDTFSSDYIHSGKHGLIIARSFDDPYVIRIIHPSGFASSEISD